MGVANSDLSTRHTLIVVSRPLSALEGDHPSLALRWRHFGNWYNDRALVIIGVGVDKKVHKAATIAVVFWGTRPSSLSH